MKEIKLTTAIEKVDEIANTLIPKGAEGTLLDVIIEEGKVLFLLEFDTTIEWYDTSELEERC